MTRENAPAGRSSATQRIVYLITILGVSAFVGFLVVLNFGHVKGEEFSPTAFQRRSFEYYEVPLVHLQLSPIWRGSSTGQTELYLINQQLVPTQAAPDSWHLVSAQISHGPVSRGDASVLIDYLDAVDEDGGRVWELWSKKHPTLAQVLWPEVASAAVKQHYLLLPDLMELAVAASRDGSPASLQRQIADSVAANYARWGLNPVSETGGEAPDDLSR